VPAVQPSSVSAGRSFVAAAQRPQRTHNPPIPSLPRNPSGLVEASLPYYTPTMAKKATAPTAKPSSLVDTRVIYCGDNLEQLKKLPDPCVDLIYIDPPFNSNRNYKTKAV
jgi:hypothetical protein